MKNKFHVITLILLFISVLSSFAQSEYTMPLFRVSASGGFGYLTATGQENINGVINKEVIDKANKNLRIATQLNGDLYYLFDTGWGFGVKYLFQKTSAEANDVIIDTGDNWHYMVSDIWENNYINFIGPSLFGYTILGEKNNLFLTSSLSSGLALLRSEASVLMKNVLITGSNLAMNTEIGLDYLFHPNLGIGVNLGYLLSTFSKVKITDGTTTQKQTLDKDSRYNASNLHLSVGLRYYINK